jgi:VWFA-related protein
MKPKSNIVSFIVVLFWMSGIVLGQAGAPQDPLKSSSATPSSASAAASPAENAAPAAPRPRFVPVLISVTDAGGNPIAGLAKEQLTLLDSNRAVQPLQVFTGHDIPLHLGIVLISAPASFSQQQAAAINLVQKVVRPNVDEAFVVTARGKKPWPYDHLEWKQDPAELAKMIQGLDRDAGLPDAFNFDLNTDKAGFGDKRSRSTLQTFGGTPVTVFDAAYAMMNSDPRPSRRVLVIFREPWPLSPGFGNRANGTVEDQLLQVIARAQQLHIATFVIGLEDPQFNGITDNNIGQNYTSLRAGRDGGAGTQSRNLDRQLQNTRMRAYNAGKVNVERMAEDTGGATFWSTKKNYPDAVNAIANQLDGEYMVTFVPGEIPGPAHSLKVTSSSGAHVLAQKVFFYAAAK